jgi:REP element-mobilizing transposase RayT
VVRARKRHVQQALRFDGKRSRKPRRGRAKGGRPAKGARSSERHEKRPSFRKYEPQHAVIRATQEIGTLRRREMYKAVRKALITTFTRSNFRIVHLSIQGTHIHLLIEADDKAALSRGMQAFQISAAKHLNAAMAARTGKARRGNVFVDRYHARTIRTPKQARNALAYVLNNWRKHRENRHRMAREHRWRLDPFSSAPTFVGWRDIDASTLAWPATYEPLPVWEPKTWLLREGWKKYGLISSTEVPSDRQPANQVVMAE